MADIDIRSKLVIAQADAEAYAMQDYVEAWGSHYLGVPSRTSYMLWKQTSASLAKQLEFKYQQQNWAKLPFGE